jgi:lipoprotein-anchoring transpeptidase ErfK/SrfK
MFAKLGLLAAAAASVLTLSTTALAEETPSSSADTTIEAALGETTVTPETDTSGTGSTEPSTTPPFGPAEPGETPRRGTQKQVQPPPPPPPPPTTQAPWDPVRLPADSGSGRRAVYSKSQQTVWAVDGNNQIIKAHRVSGRQTPLDPRPGSYQVFSRSRYTYSINNPSITWGYMVRFAHGGEGGNIGFHEIPFQYGRPVQTWSQLGQPLSGGCVRQALPDAIWMWNWAQVGTRVVVLP